MRPQHRLLEEDKTLAEQVRRRKLERESGRLPVITRTPCGGRCCQ